MKKLIAGLMLALCAVSTQAQFIAGQVLTAAQLNSQFALYLPLSGGTVSGGVTINGPLTVNGLLTATGNIGLGSLASQSPNTVVANVTAANASPMAASLPSCSTSASALNYTSGTGFSCNTAVNAAQLGGATFAAPGPIGSTTPSTGAFTSVSATSAITVPNGGTGRATLTAHGVLVGEAAAAINQTTAGSSGQPLLSGGASADPAYGTLSPSFGGTGLTTVTAHGVMLGEGTSNVATVSPSATIGQALISQGASADPIYGYPTGTLIGVRVITTTGTYTPTAGTNSVIIYLVGGGGGGAGAPATGAGQTSAGGPGGYGGTVIHRMTSGFSGQTVTIGAAGAAGTAGGNGGSGGSSTFGAILTAGGGGGGGAVGPGTSFIVGLGSSGAASSGGNILNAGSAPAYAFAASPTLVVSAAAGNHFSPGASSVSGGGGAGSAAGGSYGASGFGPINPASTAAAVGAPGFAGVCIIYEYN